MRNILRITIILLSSFYCNAQEWSMQIGGLLSEVSTQLGVDKNGNMYITGSFQDKIISGKDNIESHGGSDIFLAKFNKSGENIWTKNAGGTSNKKYLISETGNSLTIVNDKYIYVTGYFSGIANFENQIIESNGLYDIFICKYDAEGNLIWVQSFGGINQDLAYSISHDKHGDIYVVGSFQNTMKFGTKILQTQNETEIFIVKLNSDGDIIWIEQSESTSQAIAYSISSYGDNVFVAGNFEDNFQFKDAVIKSKGKTDIFILSLTVDGRFHWLKQIGGKGDEKINSIKANNERVYLAGSFTDKISTNELNVVSNGNQDILIGSVDFEGNTKWLSNIGGIYNDEAYDVDVNLNEDIIICGYFQDNLKNKKWTNKSSEGFTDAFYSIIDKSGNVKTIESFGGVGQDIATSIVAYKNDICLTGFFYENMSWNNSFLNSVGRSDMFLLKTDNDLILANKESSKITKNTIDIYPNPANAFIQISSQKPMLFIKLINSVGSTLKFIELDGILNYSLSIIDIPNGNYVIEVELLNEVYKKKVIVLKK